MDSHLKELRKALTARSDAALARWPERRGDAFAAEMAAVAGALAGMARVFDMQGDALECARTWRWAGNAYFDLGAGSGRPQLQQAVEAFREAERALADTDDAIEQVKLGYSFGQAQLLLSEGKDLALASEARTRLRAALRLARKHMPEGIAPLQEELATAEKVTALLGQVSQLDERMARVKSDLRRTECREQRSADAQEVKAVFEVLQQQFEQAMPSMDATRQAGLQSLMGSLASVVQAGTREGLSLEEIVANRGRLEALQRELEPQVRRPSLKRGGATPESLGPRLLQVLQPLKMYVGGIGMAQGCPDGMRDAAMDLFARIAKLTTWVAEAGDDAARLRQLEVDTARALAHEVRLFATRTHPLLARPVWPDADPAVDANAVFFSGNAAMRGDLAAALQPMGLMLSAEAAAGADFAALRWLGLRSANLAVFDLADEAPQVYYELGIALASGSHILLLARKDTKVPFDIAQHVSRYGGQADLRAWLGDEVQAALYSLQVRSGKESSLGATRDYAARLAESSEHGHTNSLSNVAMELLRSAGNDAIRFHDALKTLNSFLGQHSHVLLQTRWSGRYPDPLEPRNFAVMPFRPEREPIYATIAAAAVSAGVKPVRGDEAAGQEIIESIWHELCRASHITVDLSDLNLNVCLELGLADTLGRQTLLIGEQGTEKQLEARLPGIAKRRCHAYVAGSRQPPAFERALMEFFGRH